jgi:hypothetical protein
MIDLYSIVLGIVWFIVILLLSPFIFEFLGLSGVSGVEGFVAKTIPFVMLWMALTYGTRRVTGA